jgi:hypothetical protein
MGNSSVQPLSLIKQQIARLNTPRLLQLGQYLICGGSLLLFTTAVSSIQWQRKSIKTISQDAANNVLIAQRLKDAPAGMDAYGVKALLTKSALRTANADQLQTLNNNVNNLLEGKDQGKSSNANYEERRQKMAQRLMSAAEHITEGSDVERRPILTMQLATFDYLDRLQQAQTYAALGKESESLTAYRSAADILDKSLIPAADALDVAAMSKFDATYVQQKSNVATTFTWIWLAGFIVIAQLVSLQVFLSLRTKRTINLPLLLSTILIGIFTIWASVLIQSSGDKLQVAKEDAFTNLHTLRQARSMAYLTNANESRALFLKSFAAQYQQAFTTNIQKIITVPANSSLTQIAATTAKGDRSPNVGGFLGKTLGDKFVPGEAAALSETLLALDKYLATNQRIRNLATSNLNAAVTVAAQDSSFNGFLQASQRAIDIHKQDFDRAVNDSLEPLENFEGQSWSLLVLVIFLVFWGLRPRIKEYDFR